MQNAVLQIGWQVGVVSSRTIVNPSIGTVSNNHGNGFTFIYDNDHPHYEPIKNAPKPVRIWRTLTGDAPNDQIVTHRLVTHDIDQAKGVLTAHFGDPVTEEILGISAVDFAMGRLGAAIEFINQ